MRTKTSDDYLTNRAWLRDVAEGQEFILKGESALLYLDAFAGYLGEDEISVYAKAKGEYENINYHVIDDFDDIDYFVDGGILCSTFNQAVNDPNYQ